MLFAEVGSDASIQGVSELLIWSRVMIPRVLERT